MVSRRRFELPAAVAVCLFCCFTIWQLPHTTLWSKRKDFHLHEFANKLLHNPAWMLHKRNRVRAKLASPIGSHSNVGLWTNERNVVHVVHTRFMQHQYNLYNLGRARLDLFNTFTMPSIRQQTNQEFLWVFWTDPRLHGKVLKELSDEIESLPNAVLLGAEQANNVDFRELSGLSEDDLEKAFVCGNRRLLLDYHKASQSRLLIETSLDADDALSKNFVESVQAHAVRTMGNSEVKKQVEVFCPERHLEWRYYKPDDEDHWKGQLIQFHNKNFCINSGLSVAYHVEARARQLQGVVQCNVQVQLAECDHSKDNGDEPTFDQRRRRTQEQRCIGQGAERLTFMQEDLETVDHLQECPIGSMRCKNPDSESSLEFGGPMFMIPSETRSCQVDGMSELIEVQVTPSGYVPGKMTQSAVDLDVLGPDYVLAAAYIKGMDGGNLYTWDWNGQTGGIKYGSFKSPHQSPVHHVEICVIPRQQLCGSDSEENPQQTPELVPTTGDEESKNDGADGNRAEQEPVSAIDFHKTECRRTLTLVNDDTLAPSRNYVQTAVLMARTPTASGMKHVLPQKGSTAENSVAETTFDTEQSQEHAWVILEHDFGVDREEVAYLRENFEENMELILEDAVEGQCKHRFSCKESTKRALIALLEKTRRRRRERN